jgi:hypothetical protein
MGRTLFLYIFGLLRLPGPRGTGVVNDGGEYEYLPGQRSGKHEIIKKESGT